MAVTDPRQPLTQVFAVPLSVQTATPIAVQAPISYMREFHESRRITEDIQRGTIEHVFMVPGHPDEAYLDAGLAGMNIGAPHPWWSNVFNTNSSLNAFASDMYLIRRD